jgi:hypothetical protein
MDDRWGLGSSCSGSGSSGSGSSGSGSSGGGSSAAEYEGDDSLVGILCMIRSLCCSLILVLLKIDEWLCV